MLIDLRMVARQHARGITIGCDICGLTHVMDSRWLARQPPNAISDRSGPDGFEPAGYLDFMWSWFADLRGHLTHPYNHFLFLSPMRTPPAHPLTDPTMADYVADLAGTGRYEAQSPFTPISRSRLEWPDGG
jgi:hypothetical protein